MKPPKVKPFAAKSHREIPPTARSALVLLLQAHDAAASLGHDKWDFAVEIQALKEVGVNHNDLRSLICKGIAEHLVERTRPGSKHRNFRSPRGLRLAHGSCFALSAEAMPFVRENIAPDGHGSNGRLEKRPVSILPFWDMDRRELRLGDTVVKSFRQPAKNQEAILSAFQEDGWPPRIDDPLTGNSGIDSIDRLHETVKKLNRQAQALLRFLCDGRGQGVLWAMA